MTAAVLRAVVTGGNRGLGGALADALLAAGASVVVGARTPEGVETASAAISRWAGRAWAVELDHTRPETIRAATESCRASLGAVDLLVNCAAVNVAPSWPRPASKGPVEALSAAALEEMFAVNVIGPLLTCQALLPLLADAPAPRLVNVSTRRASLAETEDGGSFGYAVTKAALNMCTRKLAPWFADHKGAAVSVDPGWVATRMGGPEAPRSAVEAAAALLALVGRDVTELNGRFLDTTGRDVPW